MIDGLKQAFARIYNTIPQDILKAAFKIHDSDESLDSAIHKKVLLARVRDDMSLRGGKILRLLLDSDWLHYTSSPSPYALGMSGSYSFFHIPEEARDFRDICCVTQVRFPYSIGSNTSGAMYHDCSSRGNTASSLACSILNSVTGAGQVAAPHGIVHPGNVIELDPPQFNYIPWQVSVRLKFDDQFSGMNVSTVQPFAQLCEYAVKAHIYTNLIMEVETNMVYRGVELGIFRELVSSYSDANEKYDEILILCGGSDILEPQRLASVIRRMCPRS